MSTVQPIEKSGQQVQNFFPDVHVANAFIILQKYCQDTAQVYSYAFKFRDWRDIQRAE